MTAEQALQHPWLKALNQDVKKGIQKYHKVLLNLHDIRKPCLLLYELLVLFCQFLDDDDIKEIRSAFQHMDEDNSGIIECEELKIAYMEVAKNSSTNENDPNYMKKCLTDEQI